MEADFFKHNRDQLLQLTHGEPIILSTYCEMQRVGDEPFNFTPEPNFWYLSGIEAPDWKLVISDTEVILISAQLSETKQIFSGTLDEQTALRISGADRVLSKTAGQQLIRDLAKNHQTVWSLEQDDDKGLEFSLNPALSENHKLLERHFKSVKNVWPQIAKLRAIKQKSEIMMLRRAINLTRNSFNTVKSELKDYSFEYEAQARFSYDFEKVGASHAYQPIVAGGNNAVTLHYNSNKSIINRGDLVLMDVGANYGGYSADITRTYATTEPTARQLAIHAAVKQAKDMIINLINPGFSIKDYIEKSDLIMKEALRSVDLLNKESDFRIYFPHAVSHGLGIETHDTLGAGAFSEFRPGMILTVEPGIYVPEESIGVRLEDDILVTDEGNENLSRYLSDDL